VMEISGGSMTIMDISGGAYLLNADKEIIAYIQGYENYNSATDSFVLSKYGTLYEVPYYDTQSLLSLAEGK